MDVIKLLSVLDFEYRYLTYSMSTSNTRSCPA